MDLRFTIYDLRLTFAAASECPPVSRTGRDRVSGESYGTSIEERTTSAMPAWFAPRASRFPSPRPSPLYVFSALVGMARCAVPARVVAGGTNIPAILAFQGVAPLHAARTSQRDVPTTLNTYSPLGRGRMLRCRSAKLSAVSGRRTPRIFESAAACPLSPWDPRGRVRVRGIGLPLNTATLTFPGPVELCDSSGPYVFSAPTKNWPGARDLSRSNAGTSDARWEISRTLRQPTVLRTKVRAPFARSAITFNRSSGSAGGVPR